MNENDAGQANLASAKSKKIELNVDNLQHNGKPLLDVTLRSQRMPRDASILWPAKKRKSDEGESFTGIVRLSGGAGAYFGVKLWPRLRDGRPTLRFKPLERNAKKRFSPTPGQEPVIITLRPCQVPDGAPLVGATKRAEVSIWPRTVRGALVYELILSAKKGGAA